MLITQRPIADVKPYHRNPRRNQESVKAVADSIRRFGWTQPIVVDRDGVIIAGHTRYAAAKRLNLEHAPTLTVDLTPEQAKAYRIADNATADLSTWDYDALTAELADLETAGYPTANTALDEDTLDTLLNQRAPEQTGKARSGYAEQYGLVITCKDAREQQKVYESLTAAGHRCRVVNT